MHADPIQSSIVTPRKDVSDDDVNKICDIVRTCGYGLHQFLGPGFREKVYERGMIHRLTKAGLQVYDQSPVKVYDEDGTELLEEVMDLVVERVLIVELKAIRERTNTDVAQLLGYLKATQYRHGLLINFGAPRFFIKKYVF